MQGKWRSSRNAQTHGLTAAALPQSVKPGGVPPLSSDGQPVDEFQALLDLYVHDFDPGNQSEFDLLRSLSSQQWQLRRADAYIENFARDMFSQDPLLISRVLENFTKQQARVQRAYNQTLTLLRQIRNERLETQQAQIDNATRILKHMVQKKDPDLETWQPSDDGFDFPLEVVEANLDQWDLEKAANTDFLPPRFRFIWTDVNYGLIFDSDNPPKTQQERAEKYRREREEEEKQRELPKPESQPE